MDILTLKYFVTAVRYGSYTRAAKSLFTTQPNLSRHIQKLEDAVDANLFYQAGSKRSLTPEGQICYDLANNIIQQYDKMLQQVQRYKQGELGCLSIGHYNQFGQFSLRDAVKAFLTLHPDVKMSLFKETTFFDNLTKYLLDDLLDVIFTCEQDIIHSQGISWLKVHDYHLQAAVSPDHRLAKRDTIQLNDLENEPIILHNRELSPAIFDAIMALFHNNGISPKIIFFESDMAERFFITSTHQYVNLVTSWQQEAYMSDLHFIDIVENSMKKMLNLDLVVAWKRNNPNPLIPLFVQLFQHDFN